MKLLKVFEIKELAQDFTQRPKLVEKNNNLVLMFDYETENGRYEWTGITFKDIYTYKITKESDVEKYMIESYNEVSLIRNSNWLKDLKKDNVRLNPNEEYNHYLVYFDGFGAYEFIAKTVYQGILE